MTNRFTTARSTVAIRRWAAPAAMGLAAALTALSAAPPADAAAVQAKPAARPTEATAPRDAGDPLMAIVSIKSQQVTIYDSEGWMLRAPVSTGTKGRETRPASSAWWRRTRTTTRTSMTMPRCRTCSASPGRASPARRAAPGYAASHGCVRMPYDFAEKLFDKTQIGMRVIISPNDAEPVEFSDPALFMPSAEAIAAAPARAETLAREAQRPPRRPRGKSAAVAAARAGGAAHGVVRKLEWLKTSPTPTLRSPRSARRRQDGPGDRRGPRN